ncbi:glycosyltransferase family 2 protein [Salinimicrobium sp. HB62]|uniref:glycosyltransferase family 2 protein n=1 Tax=Salinimicrobium sp. HB62 TaxID=3077781 RepID=UPI002D782FC2|nr:glycosyltransferase [Salinimicrobium sp. HB62]
MRPLVSVIIPCYNDFLFIEQAVQSAIDQTYSQKEIIVIDDGSDLRTKAVLRKIKPKIDLLITQVNLGVIEARNKAISQAKGQYILTLDSDDYYEPTFLEKAVGILDNNLEVGMVTCWLTIRDENGVKLRVDKPTGGSAYQALFQNNAPATLLYRKVCWEQVSGYDLNLKNGYEDWEYNISVCKRGWGVVVLPEPLYNFRKKKISRNVQAKRHYSDIRNYVFKKHKDLLVENIDKTIDNFFFIIDSKQNEISKLRNSRVYKFWKSYIKPIRRKVL